MTGKQLKELRQDAGASQLELAVIIGAAQADISNWERSEEVPPVWEEQICEALAELYATKKPKRVASDRSKPPKPQKVDDSRCSKGCKYWRHESDTVVYGSYCCHYNLDTGHSRGTQPAGECDKYDPSERKKKRRKPML